jgi:Tol biopolymer transport system component
MLVATGTAGLAAKGEKGKTGGGGGSDAELVLVYTKSTSSGEDIKLASADGSNVRTLISGVQGGSGVVEACWSPDGTEVAFVGQWGGTNGLHVADVATGGVTTLTTGSYLYHPSWSPDGDLIAYSAPDGSREDVFLYDLTSDSVRNLTQTASYDESHPAWSPDGTKLAVQYAGGGLGSDIVILALNADRTTASLEKRLVLVDDSPLEGMVLEFPRPDWSRDGSYVAVGARFLGEKADLFRISVSDPTTVVNLTRTKRTTEHRPAWSPTADGMIAYRSGARSGSVEVLNLATGDRSRIDTGGANWPDWLR